MQSFPLIHVLFWIALICAPQHATQITIKAPNTTWIWTKQESGWTQSTDQTAWTVDGDAVTKKSGEKMDKQDVSKFIKGVKEQDWSKSPSLELGPLTSLARVGKTFVYTMNQGDPSEQRFVIEFENE